MQFVVIISNFYHFSEELYAVTNKQKKSLFFEGEYVALKIQRSKQFEIKKAIVKLIKFTVIDLIG